MQKTEFFTEAKEGNEAIAMTGYVWLAAGREIYGIRGIRSKRMNPIPWLGERRGKRSGAYELISATRSVVGFEVGKR